MTTTEAGHHRLEVESLTAKAVANKILSTMDVDPDEVVRFEVTIESQDERGETQTVIESSGPAAGRIVSPMLKHTDWDSEEPRKINVHVVTSEADPGNVEPEEESVDDEDEAEDEEDEDTYTVSVGTNAHAAITAMAAYIWSHRQKTEQGDGESRSWPSGKPGITVAMIYDNVEMELSREQLKDALAHCMKRDLVENVGEGGRGSVNYYHLNQNGWSSLRATGVSDDVEDFPLEELLGGGRQGATAGFTIDSRDRGEFGRDEPDVDEPVPVNAGTHKHHALTILKRIVEKYGEDKWVPPEAVYRYPGKTDFANKTSASACLSTLFLQHALVERRKTTRKNGGVQCEYRLNKVGRGELNRLGDADI